MNRGENRVYDAKLSHVEGRSFKELACLEYHLHSLKCGICPVTCKLTFAKGVIDYVSGRRCYLGHFYF